MKYINYTTYTDTDAYEVLEISKSGKTAKVRALDSTRINQDEDHFSPGGFCGHTSHGLNGQQWSFSSNEERSIEKMSLRNDGFWRFVGTKATTRGCVGTLSDEPYKYYDYNF